MNLKEMIEEDLGHFDDSDPAPRSLTIPGKHWRHYELGPIVGFVVYAKEYPDGETRFVTSEINEDDGIWFVPPEGDHMHAYWLDVVSETLQRMVAWKNEHLRIGFRHGEDGTPVWEEVVVKPIEEK